MNVTRDFFDRLDDAAAITGCVSNRRKCSMNEMVPMGKHTIVQVFIQTALVSSDDICIV